MVKEVRVIQIEGTGGVRGIREYGGEGEGHRDRGGGGD